MVLVVVVVFGFVDFVVGVGVFGFVYCYVGVLE